MEAESMADCASTILHRLPPPLLALVLQFIPLPDKLTQFPRLHRAFPPLTPPAFNYDSFTLCTPARTAWRSSPRLQRLLSTVRAVLYTVDTFTNSDESNAAEFEHDNDFVSLLPPAAPSLHSFPLIRQAVLRLPGADVQQTQDVMRTLFESDDVVDAAATPRTPYALLHSLRLAVNCICSRDVPLQLPFVRPLLSLPSLHTLALSKCAADDSPPAILDWPAFRQLLTLPLTHLDLSGAWVSVPSAWDVEAEEAALVDRGTGQISSTWKALMWPRIRPESQRVPVMDWVLGKCCGADGVDGQGALSYMRVSVCAQAELACLTRVSTLTSLVIAAEKPFIDVSPLCEPTVESASSRPLLFSASSVGIVQPPSRLPPLRHLSFTHDRHFGHIPRGMLGGAADALHDTLRRRVQQYVDLLHRYRSTLMCIELQGLLVGISIVPILEAVFSCSQLRKCTLSVSLETFPASSRSPLSLPALPHLHTLALEFFPVSDDQLPFLLAACPALEKLRLRRSSDEGCNTRSVLHLLELLGRLCRRVKDVEVCSAPQEQTEEGDAMYLTSLFAASASATHSSSSATSPALTQLTRLTLHRQTWTATLLGMLVHLLRDAPLQHLDIHDAPLRQIHLLAPLSHLLRLDIGYTDTPGQAANVAALGVMPPTLRRFFARAHDGSSQSHQCVSEEEVAAAVTGCLLSDERLKKWQADPRLTYQAFVTERIFAGGMDGREAFFQELRRLREDSTNEAEEASGSGGVAMSAAWQRLTSWMQRDLG